ncbi:MAG: 50S ribosomal protein L32 [Patescibacteria group bacterium]|nr:50S ribosomal protein L32 [Patescibacteria group bacterium]
MTPLPKRKLSRGRQGKRRKSIILKTATTVKCSNCGAVILPHKVCAFCGFYQGKLIRAPKVKKKKSENQA